MDVSGQTAHLIEESKGNIFCHKECVWIFLVTYFKELISTVEF